MIRPAERQDTAAIWGLIRELALYEKLEHQHTGSVQQLEACLFELRVADCLVAEDDGRIVGYAITFPTFSTFLARPGLWLEDLYVVPEFRGNGIGKRLFLEVVAKAKAKGCGRVEWSVLDWNEPSIAFYESLGARILPDWKTCRLDGVALAELE